MTDEETEHSEDGSPADPMALVQQVLRESYLEATEDLRVYAQKVRAINKHKQIVRRYLRALREFDAQMRSAAREAGADPCSAEARDTEIVAKAFDERARAYPVDESARELCIPDRVPPSGITTTGALEEEIAKWEEKLSSIGDDSQLANVDLQNMLQKQQQALQMMSNISKMLHDTAASVIRKMGG
jgi:hypothetical protein